MIDMGINNFMLVMWFIVVCLFKLKVGFNIMIVKCYLVFIGYI